MCEREEETGESCEAKPPSWPKVVQPSNFPCATLS